MTREERKLKFREFGLKDTKMFYYYIDDCQSMWVFPDQKTSGCMQYTGLNDKNGKEIYEGDIVEYANLGSDRDEYDKIGEVHRIEDCFCIGEYDSLAKAVLNKCIEVKGNIYENPELLESK